MVEPPDRRGMIPILITSTIAVANVARVKQEEKEGQMRGDGEEESHAIQRSQGMNELQQRSAVETETENENGIDNDSDLRQIDILDIHGIITIILRPMPPAIFYLKTPSRNSTRCTTARWSTTTMRRPMCVRQVERRLEKRPITNNRTSVSEGWYPGRYWRRVVGGKRTSRSFVGVVGGEIRPRMKKRLGSVGKEDYVRIH